MSALYRKFKKLQKVLKSKNIEKNKDLRKLAKIEQKLYYSFREFLAVDKRLAPKRIRKEFLKYKATGLQFKSEAIGFDLSKTDYFPLLNQKYRSRNYLIDNITDAMLTVKTKLDSIKKSRVSIDISYKKKRRVTGYRIDVDSLDFLDELDEDYYINIDGTSYNKNGLDFIFDYHNQSNDWVKNLQNPVKKQKILIYKR